MTTLVLYTKRNCPLCDEAKEVLLEMQREGKSNFSFAEVDIMNDVQLYAYYKDMVPVVSLDGEKLLYGVIQKEVLKRFLEVVIHET